MKAIRIHRFGPTEEVLQFEEVPTPEPGAREVLVKVEAASLNRADLGLRSGNYRISPENLPVIPGREFAGTVAAVGGDIREFHLGQRIVAQPGLGGYAQFALAQPVHARPLPEGFDPVAAAAMPTVFLTAYFALSEDAKMRSGDRVLIQAGGSGVGIAAIQIAKLAGARVLTTAGTDQKCRRLRDLGADEAINYSAKDFKEEVLRLTGGRGVDVVLEMVGGEVYNRSLQCLAPGGRLVSIGGAAGPPPASSPSLGDGRKASRFSITNFLASQPERFAELDRFVKLAQEEKLRVVIDRTYPLNDARSAQRHLQSRQHFGKIVLTMV